MYELIKVKRQSFVMALSAAMASTLLLIILSIISYIMVKGGGHFWPQALYHVSYQDSQLETKNDFLVLESTTQNELKFAGNQQVGSHHHIQLNEQQIRAQSTPDNLAFIQLKGGQQWFAIPQYFAIEPMRRWPVAKDPAQISKQLTEFAATVSVIDASLAKKRRQELAQIQRTLAEYDRLGVAESAPARQRHQQAYLDLNQQIQVLQEQLASYQLFVKDGKGQQIALNVAEIDRFYFPNNMGFFDKVRHFFYSLFRFIVDDPFQANTSGGVFPALFGTLLMVLLMTLVVTPLGVVAAIYLHEYAPVNLFTNLVRSFVRNLASVPSVVYGVFGLGLLVYQLGTSIDDLFFADQLPTPTFGTPGLFWTALTMAFLTLPVVVVATEEGLSQVPESLRKGSYALGATQGEMLFRTLLPIASPGIMTGVILAIARGAGEVAPIMLVGAVKFAPALPIDLEFPFVHFERQFMHLGVLIYDGAFHGTHIGQGNGFMFASCLLLLVLVLVLNLSAVFVRGRLRQKYAY